jgi:hypothetical protein
MKFRLSRSVATLAMLAVSGLALAAHSHRDLCSGFVPENSLKIPVGTRSAGGLTEAQFNTIIDRAEKLYIPDMAVLGGKFHVNRLWTDATVNANAEQTGSDWVVNMYGGLARHPAINFEGFSLVICHEIGHHMGGAPKMQTWWGQPDWATNEGGADYYSTLKCLRRFFAEDDNESIIASAQIDPLAKSRCEQEFPQHNDQLLCLRSSMAATSAGLVFMDLRKETKAPQFSTPDAAIVTEMFDDHPGTQCRLDTYFNGATCHIDHTAALSNTDYHEGSCAQPNDAVGFRPLCWFKP